MLISENIEDVKRFMAKSNKYFYLSGWVSLRDKESIEKILSKYDGLLISFKDPIEQGIKPPTKLRNSNFFKPFELLVNMYGVPSYTEKDPTPVFAITYMLLYGAMFGDFGQGAVFFLGGIFLSKKNKGFGGLLKHSADAKMQFWLTSAISCNCNTPPRTLVIAEKHLRGPEGRRRSWDAIAMLR